MAKWPIRIAPGQDLTPFKAKVLKIVGDAGEAGTTATPMTPGGTLGALAQFGLLERAPTPAGDVLGGSRYRATEAGRKMLARLKGRV
ncbi:hypothetical protein [Brevundimonas sp. Bb-A]|jgi:hypothetical protein|uniref:hypothetical protein n=1 Tax=Brevundimonas sp. Bb-A TaxID=2560058 RepID=UPI00128F0B5D|nr:hypothetical protein [Brevundimonas sp. Bb-A]QFU30294.1 hypothetical protein BSP_01325 [Brevundimonas sp. Bb-A]